MMKKILTTAVFAAFLTAPMISYAEGYIGLSAGQNKMDLSGAKESTAFSLFGGYSFNEYIAGELAYINFGSADTSTAGASVKGNAASIAAVGSLPLGKAFSLFAKLGFASSSIEVLSVSQTKSDMTYGIGGQFNATRQIGIRLGYDNFRIGDPTTKDSALTSIGVLYKF